MFKRIISSLIFCLANVSMAASFGFYTDVSYNGVWNVDSEEEVVPGLGIRGLDELSGMGLTLGSALRFPINENLAVQPGLLFTYRSRTSSVGFEVDDEDPEVQESMDIIQMLGDFSIRQILVEVPLQLRFEAANKFFVAAGPVMTINVNSHFDAGAISLVGNNLVNDLTFSGMITLGKSFPMSSGMLDLGVSFQMAFTSLISEEIEVPGVPMLIDGTMFMEPRDFAVRFAMTYWFI